MTTFTLQGHFMGTLSTITWTDGELSSDNAQLLDLVRRDAAGYEGRMLASTAGVTTDHDHLQNPYVAQMLMGIWFIERAPEVIAGEVPPLPAPPAGAVQ